MSVNHCVVTCCSPLDWVPAWVRATSFSCPCGRPRPRSAANAVYCFTSSFQIIFQLFLFFGSLLVAIYHTILYLCVLGAGANQTKPRQCQTHRQLASTRRSAPSFFVWCGKSFLCPANASGETKVNRPNRPEAQ